MSQLSLLDAIFLFLETADNPKHVGALLVFDPPPAGASGFVADLVAQFRTLQPKAPFDRRPRTHLLGLPTWETVAEPDLSYHVRHVLLPPGSDAPQLLEHVARMHEPLLDREMPLWEMHFVEGLRDGAFAIYAKIHHACVDGASGVLRIQASLHDDPDDRSLRAPWGDVDARAHRSHHEPSVLGRLADFAASVGSHLRAGSELSLAALQRTFEAIGLVAGHHYVPFSAPRTALNRTIHRARSIAVQSLDVDRVVALAHAHAATVNDVVLTVIDHALHRYLREHRVDTTEPLVAMVPMSLREPGDARANTQACLLYVELGGEQASPRERLEQVRAAAARAKADARSYSATALADHSMMVIGLAELIGRVPLTDGVRPVGNVLVSNVPGSEREMFLHGARLRGAYPLSTLMPGCALNVTLLRQGSRLDFGFVASRDVIPDVASLADYVGDAFAELSAG